MKLKIISDGSMLGTRIVNEATGEAVQGVQSINFTIDIRGQAFPVQYATITLYIENIELNIDDHFVNRKAIVMK